MTIGTEETCCIYAHGEIIANVRLAVCLILNEVREFEFSGSNYLPVKRCCRIRLLKDEEYKHKDESTISVARTLCVHFCIFLLLRGFLSMHIPAFVMGSWARIMFTISFSLAGLIFCF